MKFAKKIVVALAIAGSCAAWAVNPDLPQVEILGKNYYEYKIKKGDSLFGIAKEFGWDLNTLSSLNPKAISPLEKGMKIYYPAAGNATNVASATEQVATVRKPLNHKVKLGETVFGISKIYDIPVETIFELNPTAKEGIREGETLRLSASAETPNAEYYVIRKGDTLSKVARDNHTTVAAIMKENPGVSERNFRAGETIRLPEEGTGLIQVKKVFKEAKLAAIDSYKVGKKDTWSTISEKTGVSESELRKANPEVGEKLKNKAQIAIPQIDTIVSERVVVERDPRELTPEGIKDIYQDVHQIVGSVDSLGSVKVGILMSETSSKKDLEFVRGALTAIDKIKNSGVKVDLVVMDGNRTSTDVLTELSDVNPDIILLTSEKGIPAYLSEYAEVSQTPMVNTFDVRNELYTSNPYIIQLLTPSNYFNDEIAATVRKNFDGYELVFVGVIDPNDQLALALQEQWDKKKSHVLSYDELRNFKFQDDHNYLVYGDGVKKEEVSRLLNIVSDRQLENPLATISFFGRPNWIVYDESLSDKLHLTSTIIPSRFYYDKGSTEARQFEDGYKGLFGRSPQKSYPMYAGLGYDAALYFIESMAKTGFDMNAFSASRTGVQNEFQLSRPGNWTGLVNPVVYLVKFTPYDTIEKIPVK